MGKFHLGTIEPFTTDALSRYGARGRWTRMATEIGAPEILNGLGVILMFGGFVFGYVRSWQKGGQSLRTDLWTVAIFVWAALFFFLSWAITASDPLAAIQGGIRRNVDFLWLVIFVVAWCAIAAYWRSLWKMFSAAASKHGAAATAMVSLFVMATFVGRGWLHLRDEDRMIFAAAFTVLSAFLYRRISKRFGF